MKNLIIILILSCCFFTQAVAQIQDRRSKENSVQITEQDIKEIRILLAEKNSLKSQVKQLKDFLKEFKSLTNKWKNAYNLAMKEINLHKEKTVNNEKIIALQEQKIKQLNSKIRQTRLIGAITTTIPIIGIVLLLL